MAAGAAWAVTQQFDVSVTGRVVASVAAGAVPLVISEVREWFKQDDTRAKVYQTHLRLYSRRHGIPVISTIRDFTSLNVTSSRRLSGSAQSPYVARNRDPEFEELLDHNIFVLLIGDSKAGKTRMAAEGIQRKFPGRRLVFPDSVDSLAALLDADLDFHRTVVWLDEVQRYLDKTGLVRLLDYLASDGAPTEVTVVATIREQVYEDYIPHGALESPYWAVLKRAARLHIDRKFSGAELELAAQAFKDPHLLAALDRYGLAEYLAAGPDLIERLENAMAARPVAAAVVLAAADWTRAGLNRPIPRSVLSAVVADYSTESGIARPDARQIAKAVAWAQEPVYAASSLLSVNAAGYMVFDYVVEHVFVQLQTSVPDTMWIAAITAAKDGDEALQIGLAAFEQNREDIALQAFEVSVRDTAQVNAKLAAYNYARMLERADRTDEALVYYRTAAEARHIEAAVAAGRLLEARADLIEAARFYRLAAEAGAPASQFALGKLLRDRDPNEAIRWLGQAAEAGHAEAAAEAADLLHSRGNTTEAARFYQLAEKLRNAGAIVRRPPASIAARETHPARRIRSTGRALRRCEAIIEPVNALEGAMTGRSDAELRALTDVYRQRLADGASLDDLLPEAFAAVREAARRVRGIRAYDVQIAGGAALHLGYIASMRPGEGRSLTTTLPSYLNALAGEAVHVISVDDATANRDAEAMGAIHRFLGLETSLIVPNMTREAQAMAYSAAVIYGAPATYVFDYLHDTMAWESADRVQHGHSFAIVDDADILMLDKGRQDFDIPGPAGGGNRWHREFTRIASMLAGGTDYEVDSAARRVYVTDKGLDKVEDLLGIDSLYAEVNVSLIGYLDAALAAKELYRYSEHYTVRQGRLILIDEVTGSLLFGHKMTAPLQQALEAKEGLAVSPETVPSVKIQQSSYFRLYRKLAGITGSGVDEAESFRLLYDAVTIEIPTRHPVGRIDRDDWYYTDNATRWSDLADLVATRHETGQPVLVDVTSSDQAQAFSGTLAARGIQHKLLTSINRESENDVLADAGGRGAVTVATNVYQSRVDIPLGGRAASRADHDDVVSLGGLVVIGSQRRLSRRDDNRLRDLAGRRGEPGESIFMVCRGDPLLNAQLRQAPTFGVSGPVISRMVSRALASFQRQLAISQLNQLTLTAAYDSVFEEQRKAIFALREDALEGKEILELVESYLRDTIAAYVDAAALSPRPEWDMDTLNRALMQLSGVQLAVPALEAGPASPGRKQAVPQAKALTRDELIHNALAAVQAKWNARVLEFGDEVWFEVVRRVLLSVIDRNWREQIITLDTLRDGAALGSLRGLDPLVHYRREARETLEVMMDAVKEETVGHMMNLQIQISDA